MKIRQQQSTQHQNFGRLYLKMQPKVRNSIYGNTKYELLNRFDLFHDAPIIHFKKTLEMIHNVSSSLKKDVTLIFKEGKTQGLFNLEAHFGRGKKVLKKENLDVGKSYFGNTAFNSRFDKIADEICLNLGADSKMLESVRGTTNPRNDIINMFIKK